MFRRSLLGRSCTARMRRETSLDIIYQTVAGCSTLCATFVARCKQKTSTRSKTESLFQR